MLVSHLARGVRPEANVPDGVPFHLLGTLLG